MSDKSPRHGLPYIMPSQAQKHVTHNEALRHLDVLSNLELNARDENTPPSDPAEGDCYGLGSSPVGVWVHKAGQIALFSENAWFFSQPFAGLRGFDKATSEFIRYTDTGWEVITDQTDTTEIFGINTSADPVNRLAVKSDAALLSHDDVTPGTGDIRLTINKASATNTASMIFQTGFSGRAEFGLTGEDAWHVKVSPDGQTWTDTLRADPTDGTLAHNGLRSMKANSAPVNGLVFTPGGDGTVSIYRQNSTSEQNPRQAIISDVTDNIITLTTPVAEQFFNSIMTNVSYMRIWNLSLSADQHDAWIAEYIDANRFRIKDSQSLSGWTSGHTIQMGEPYSLIPNRCFALDISPMLINLFGQSFRQTGLMAKSFMADGAIGKISITPTGVGGSFLNAATHLGSTGVTIMPCSVLSPISNSNLVYVREAFSGTNTTRLITSIAVLV